MWNLPPPLSFQGLHPDKPLRVYQRHLPHWRQDGATYFVTYRLADSPPQAKLEELEFLRAEWGRRLSLGETAQESRPTGETAQENRPTSETAQENRPTLSSAALEALAHALQERVERWLDQGMGRCVLRKPSLAALVSSSMHHFDDQRYELGCYVVMPNHVHVVVRPLIPEIHPLEEILGSWKKHSSRRINRELHTRGELWQEESYDRIIRDAEHLWRVIQYLGSNPERAGLGQDSCPLWIRPQWAKCGWKFEAVRTAQESRPT